MGQQTNDTYHPRVAGEVDYAHICRFMALLRVVVWAERQADAADGMESFLAAASRSASDGEAAFAAAQWLRAFDVIDDAEAAYVFNELYELEALEHQWTNTSDSGRAWTPELPGEYGPRRYQEPAEDEFDDLCVEVERQASGLKAAFHRIRGEAALADMVLQEDGEHVDWCLEGKWRLVESRPNTKAGPYDRWPLADPAEIAMIRERLVSASAAKQHGERLDAQAEVLLASKDVAPTSAIAAARELRSLGMLSAREASALILGFIDPLVQQAIEADRECKWIKRQMEEIEEPVRRERGEKCAGRHFPKEWGRLKRVRERRLKRIKAQCLRRIGELELANVLLGAGGRGLQDC